MDFVTKGALGAAFLVAVDIGIAAMTGLTGIHSLAVGGGEALGAALEIPHLDWDALTHGEFAFEHPTHAGHDHGRTFAPHLSSL